MVPASTPRSSATIVYEPAVVGGGEAGDRTRLTIATWDDDLVRDVRLLVPIDVQALVVGRGAGEPMVRLRLGGQRSRRPRARVPGPVRPGRDRGLPASTSTGRCPTPCCGASSPTAPAPNRLALPPLPDRWVVLRLVTPSGATQAAVRGWVLEADRAVQVDLGAWPEAAAAGRPAGALVAAGELTGTAGGAATWAATYDAVENRFALHDPLDDLATLAPNGVDGDAATYVVAGWWSDPARDPLDAALDKGSLDDLLASLGWSAVDPVGPTRPPTSARATRSHAPAVVGRARLARTFRFAKAEPPPAPGITRKAVTPLTEPVAHRAGRLARPPRSSPGPGGPTPRCCTAACTASPRARGRRRCRRQPPVGRPRARRARRPRRRRHRRARVRGLRGDRRPRRAATPSACSALHRPARARAERPERRRRGRGARARDRVRLATPAACGARTGSWPAPAARRAPSAAAPGRKPASGRPAPPQATRSEPASSTTRRAPCCRACSSTGG